MKQSLNEIKRLQQLAGIITETKVVPKDEYNRLKPIIADTFEGYGITDAESFENELNDGGLMTEFAYEIAKLRGNEHIFDDDDVDEELHGKYHILSDKYLRKYANEMFNYPLGETKIGPKQISKQYILQVLEDNGIDFGQSLGNYLSDNNNEIETESNEWLGVMSDITGKDAYNEEFTSDDYVKLGNFIRAMENIGVTLKDNNNYVNETKIGPRPGPITINAIANNKVTFHPEDFDTWDQFKEFCDKLRNDEDFKYDAFFENLDNSRTEWEVTDITQRNGFM
jgi:hypothetical protein